MTSHRLDEYQKIAIYYPAPRSVIVEAPPGHGKTFVMARRIEYILQSGYIRSPNRILGLTFTNAASSEMLSDIRLHLNSEQQSLIQVMTFHSFCYKILRAYGNVIGINRDFMIIGELQQQRFLNTIIEKYIDPLPSPDLSQAILEAYREWIKEKILRNNAQYVHPSHQQEIAELHTQYVKNLNPDQIDYNHLLVKTIGLFTENPTILEFYRSVFRHIIVDEFQDTNPLQFALLSLMVSEDNGHPSALPSVPVYILADREQAIYCFQGATPENIEKAKKEFKSAELELHINYRSTSKKLIAIADKLRGKEIKPGDKKTNLTISMNPQEEAQRICDQIQEYQGAKHELCVIAQNHYLLSDIRDSFDACEIPYIFVPDFRAKAIENKYGSAFGAISRLADEKNSTAKLTSRIRQVYKDEKLNWHEDDVLSALLDLAANFEQTVLRRPLCEKARLFYNDIFIEIHWGKLLRKRVRNKVFLSTIHGVKGLQFAQVHLCGLVNYGHIHSSICYPCYFGKNLQSYQHQLNQEPATTLYVGVSRAQDELFLYAVQNAANGKKRSPICLLANIQSHLNISTQVRFCGQSG